MLRIVRVGKHEVIEQLMASVKARKMKLSSEIYSTVRLGPSKYLGSTVSTVLLELIKRESVFLSKQGRIKMSEVQSLDAENAPNTEEVNHPHLIIECRLRSR